MTDKEFRRLSRRELVEIIYELQKQLADCQSALARTREALATRETRLMQAGSLAEAALSLNDVFAHAQAAADQYVEDVNRVHHQAQAQAQEILDQAEREAEATLEKAKQAAQAILQRAQEEQQAILAQGKLELEQARKEQDAILAQGKLELEQARKEQDAFDYWMNL